MAMNLTKTGRPEVTPEKPGGVRKERMPGRFIANIIKIPGIRETI
jgi:hypothetical protein